MIPITRTEMFLANAAGQSNGDLPTPVTREETYLNAVCERLDNIDKPTDTQVQSAVDDYLDDYLADHGIVFNTSAEITEVLHG